MKLLLLIDTYWTAAVLQAGYEKEYLKTAPPQCLQWKAVESKLSMNKWERRRRGKREELSWDPSEHHRCQGAQSLRKRGEGGSGPKALRKTIKQVFKEQPEVWADSTLEMKRSKGLLQASETTYDLCTHCTPSPLASLMHSLWSFVSSTICKSSGDWNDIVFTLQCQSSGAHVW